MVTKVEFEVEGSTVEELLDNAMNTAVQVAGGKEWSILQRGRVQEADSVSDGNGYGNVQRIITRWRQEFVIKVDF